VARGVNTGVVQGTPGGGGVGAGVGTGAGGTSGGAAARARALPALVSSTLGIGTTVPSYDPVINATVYNDHTSQLLTNQVIWACPSTISIRTFST